MAFQGEPCYLQIEGDLEEEFHQRESHYGIAAARRWYYREICRNLWSMIWRGVTIQVILLALLCITLRFWLLGSWLIPATLKWVLSGAFHFRLSPEFNFYVSRFTTDLLFNFLYPSITGLFSGIVCSWILNRHERMVRVVFGAFCLSLIETQICSMFSFSSKLIWSLLARACLQNACFLFGVVMGSIWVERNRRTRRVSKCHPTSRI